LQPSGQTDEHDLVVSIERRIFGDDTQYRVGVFQPLSRNITNLQRQDGVANPLTDASAAQPDFHAGAGSAFVLQRDGLHGCRQPFGDRAGGFLLVPIEGLLAGLRDRDMLAHDAKFAAELIERRSRKL
jgi:hypothetical protein